jgi:hypothetical protein
VLDIKPYLPYADSLPAAHAGFAPAAPALLPVQWSEEALAAASTLALSPDLRALIDEVLAQDPRPAYRTTQPDAHEYGVWLAKVNVRFIVDNHGVQVCGLEARP